MMQIQNADESETFTKLAAESMLRGKTIKLPGPRSHQGGDQQKLTPRIETG